MHNIKNSFLRMLKIYLHLRNTLIKFLNIKPIIVLKMEAKNLIKNRLRKNLTMSNLLIGKTHEDLLQDKFMSHLRFKNLFKVIMITHATMQ